MGHRYDLEVELEEIKVTLENHQDYIVELELKLEKHQQYIVELETLLDVEVDAWKNDVFDIRESEDD